MASREMQAAENERAVIEAYLEEHQLDAALNDAVNAIVKARPPDPLVELATSLRAQVEEFKTRLEQLEANWRAATVTLPQECLKAVDEIHLRRRNPNLHD